MRVLSGISLLVWLVSIAFSDDHRPLNYWLVIALGFLFVTAVVWGVERGRHGNSDGGGVHHYHAPVTFNYGALAPNAPPRDVVGPETKPKWAEREIVRLADYVELRDEGPPVIRNRDFRNVHLVGPILLGVRNSQFIGSSIGVVNHDPNTAFFELPPGTTKVGVALFENCSMIRCLTENVAFVGTPEEVAWFRDQLIFPDDPSGGEPAKQWSEGAGAPSPPT